MPIILTAIAYVHLNFLSSQQAPVKQMTVQEAESHLEHGEFLPGSMAPKVEAAIAFLRHSGQRVFIGLPEELPHLLSGAAGTQIVPSKSSNMTERQELLMHNNGIEIERKDTALRLVYTLFFVLIVRVVEAVVGVVVLFSLAFTLITKRPPSTGVKRFANRTISYLYHILRYATYNETTPPFPFADFPDEVEPVASDSSARTTHEPTPTTHDHDV